MTYNELTNLKELQDLSPREKEEVEKILKEFSNKGKSDTYNALIWNDYEEIPVDVETFLKDPRYLGRGLIDEEGRFTVFPYWVETMKKIFPNNRDTAYNTLILTGAIGIGKSFFADLCLLYQLHRLLCLKDPYLFYGLQPIDKITISLLNITIDAAKGVAWDKLQQLIQTSDWFLAHGKLKGKSNIQYVPDKKIELIVGSKNGHVIGRALFASFEDEVNFSGITTDVEKIKARALKLITQVDARMQSRFMKGDKPCPTLNIIASSKDSEQSFLETYIETKKKNESKTTLIIDEPQWVIRTDKDSKEKFYVAVGNKFLASELIPLNATEEQKQEYVRKGYSLLAVPIGYYESFRDNIDIALTDVAGISTVNALKYISGVRWNEIKNKNFQNLFTKEEIEVGNAKDDLVQYEQFIDLTRVPKNLKGKPLFIHLDMSMTGDKTGISGIWIVGKKQSQDKETSQELIFQLAFDVAIKAPKGYQVSFEKNRAFIRWLRNQGFNICWVSSDTFQSAQIQQQLKADGFNTGITSVDRVEAHSKVCLPYQYLKSAIYERRLIIYDKCDSLTTEIINLERLSNGKIEHPNAGKTGSKDIADSVAGAIYNASQHAEEYGYDFGETLESTLEVSSSINNEQEQRKQIQMDFEEQLQKMFDPMARYNKQNKQEKIQQNPNELAKPKVNPNYKKEQEEMEKSKPLQVLPPNFLNEQPEQPVILMNDMIIW